MPPRVDLRAELATLGAAPLEARVEEGAELRLGEQADRLGVRFRPRELIGAVGHLGEGGGGLVGGRGGLGGGFSGGLVRGRGGFRGGLVVGSVGGLGVGLEVGLKVGLGVGLDVGLGVGLLLCGAGGGGGVTDGRSWKGRVRCGVVTEAGGNVIAGEISCFWSPSHSSSDTFPPVAVYPSRA